MSPRLTSLMLASWALCSLALCKADAQITPVAAAEMGTVTALIFVWPVDPDDRGNLGQDYAQFSWGKTNYYHTGLDMEGTSVRAAASGHIVKIQGNDIGCNPAIPGACEDHGYGNTVIVKHSLESSAVYSQYSHLASIEASLLAACGPIDAGRRNRRTCTTPVPVNGGTTPLGTVGGSGYGKPDFWLRHLHFETKSFSTLGTTGDDAGEFGYTSNHPDRAGYSDPILYLHPFSVASGRIGITDDGVSLRVGPGGSGSTAYRSVNTVNKGETYDALRVSEGTTTPACPEGWYQLRRTDGDCSIAANCFADTSRPGSSIPDGWVCARFVSVPGPLCDIQMSKPSYVSGDTVTAQVLRIVNPTATLLAVELKLWFEVPGLLPLTFVNLGADGSVKLPPGFTLDAGPLALFTVTPTLPPGAYAFNCRFLEPVTGRLQTEDLNPFTFSLSAGSPWPMFGHDPQHTGQSQFFGPQTNDLKWSKDFGLPSEGTISPSIGSDGVIYVAVAGKLWAFNPDGTTKWIFTPPDIGFTISGTPAIASDGTLYIGGGFVSPKGYFYAINQDGTLKWKFNTGINATVFASSPVIDSQGTIYVGFGDSTKKIGKFFAFNLDGTVKWSYESGEDFATPAVGLDGRIYVSIRGGIILCFSPDGQLVWQLLLDLWPPMDLVIGSDGTLYAVTGKKVYAVNPDKTVKWVFTANTLFLMDTAPAIAQDGTVYTQSSDGRLYALRPDGSLKWTFMPGGQVTSRSIAIGSDGTSYFGSNDGAEFRGTFHAVDADGVQKWSYASGVDGFFFTSSAIGADRTLYVGGWSWKGVQKLYAFGFP